MSAPAELEVFPSKPVLVREELRADEVLDVAEDRALALVVTNYYLLLECRRLGRILLGSNHWSTYAAGSGAEKIGVLGNALYGCMGDEFSEECEAYFANAYERNRAVRAAMKPYAHPADRVRLELDYQWPAGTELLRIGGVAAYFGLSRLVRVGGEIKPHTDRADWDVPCPETADLTAQLFLNIYLENAEGGGDLELWDMHIETKDEYDALRSASTYYALDRERLPEPAAVITVEPGTLVIANASKPHAVTACTGSGQRLSVSGFLGFSGPDKPLKAFS